VWHGDTAEDGHNHNRETTEKPVVESGEPRSELHVRECGNPQGVLRYMEADLDAV